MAVLSNVAVIPNVAVIVATMVDRATKVDSFPGPGKETLVFHRPLAWPLSDATLVVDSILAPEGEVDTAPWASAVLVGRATMVEATTKGGTSTKPPGDWGD